MESSFVHIDFVDRYLLQTLLMLYGHIIIILTFRHYWQTLVASKTLLSFLYNHVAEISLVNIFCLLIIYQSLIANLVNVYPKTWGEIDDYACLSLCVFSCWRLWCYTIKYTNYKEELVFIYYVLLKFIRVDYNPVLKVLLPPLFSKLPSIL